MSRDVIARASALRWAAGSGEVLVKSMVRSGLASLRTSCRSSGSSGRGRDGRRPTCGERARDASAAKVSGRGEEGAAS